MVFVKEQFDQEKWYTENLSYFIPEDHVSRFVVSFIDEFFENYDFSFMENKTGRPRYPPGSLLKILIYASVDKVSSTARIADNLKFHQVYQFVAGGLTPSERTLRRFKSEYSYLFDLVHAEILKYAKEQGWTDFDHVSLDGTIAKSNNSPYNMIRLKEIELLLELLEHDNEYIDNYLNDKNNNKIRESAYDLLTNNKKTKEEKIDFLKELKSILEDSQQSSVGMHSTDARWMKNKKGIIELSFNIQAAVDHQSKLIVSLNAVQNPTDHHQLIPQINNVLMTINQYPNKISADYTYRGDKEFKFLNEKGIDGYIPNQKQARQNKGNKPKNPFHKHYFKYNYEKNEFTCPENQILKLKNQYTYKDAIRSVYYTNKCKDCTAYEKCTKSNVRNITEYGSIYTKQMTEKMNSEKGKKEYSKRISTVEPVFGILKLHYNINQLKQKEIKDIQNELTLMGIGYNINRIFTIKKDINKTNKKNLQNFFNNIKEKYTNSKIIKEILI